MIKYETCSLKWSLESKKRLKLCTQSDTVQTFLLTLITQDRKSGFYTVKDQTIYYFQKVLSLVRLIHNYIVTVT